MRKLTFAVAAGALLFAGHAYAADPFTLTSSAFKDGTLMPKKMAGANKANPNCVGENVSPALSWANPPAGTKSYALLMFDPEGRPPGRREPLGCIRHSGFGHMALPKARSASRATNMWAARAR